MKNIKQKKDRYEMHKYWGKKPASDLNQLITKYSTEGDVVFDPFSGYGVFCCEAYLLQRNVICNDLNPISNFIQEQLFVKDIDFIKLENEFKLICRNMEKEIEEWYGINVPGDEGIAISILRNNDDEILKCKYTSKVDEKIKVYTFSNSDKQKFIDKESQHKILNWYPSDTLIENSRISAKRGMKVKDLFTIRTLSCHSLLYKLINEISSGSEKELLLLAFTSNLANCSKLVPPIKSRGELSQGAWMTGFYWGETYIENNVLHYFKNRYSKVIKGKKDYLAKFNSLFYFSGLKDRGKVKDISSFSKDSYGYKIINVDTKKLNIASESIDYIFTDPPYGDSVPYFEQSIIWNSWLKFEVDYEREIVISNSSQRDKNINNYCIDLEKAILEIYRVLRFEKYFSITFHSLSGSEWNCLTNALIKSGFELCDFYWLTQNTFTPRQLNKAKSVKGDILITLKKTKLKKQYEELNENETKNYYVNLLSQIINDSEMETNTIFIEVVKDIFNNNLVLKDINFFDILNSNFKFLEQKWSKDNAR